MNDTLPLKEGIFEGGSNFKRELNIPTVTLTDSKTLRDYEKDYVLFTHALFFVRGLMLVDPINDFHEIDRNDLIVISLPKKAFSGLGVYDHLVYGIVREKWKPFLKFMSSVGGVDRVNKYYWQAVPHEVPMFDSFATQYDVLKFVTLTVFGVSSNVGAYICIPAYNPQKDPTLRVVKAKPDEKLSNISNNFFGEKYATRVQFDDSKYGYVDFIQTEKGSS